MYFVIVYLCCFFKMVLNKNNSVSRGLFNIFHSTAFLLLMNASCLYAPLMAPTESKNFCVFKHFKPSQDQIPHSRTNKPSVNFCKIYSLEALSHFQWLMFKCSIERSCCKQMNLCAVFQ